LNKVDRDSGDGFLCPFIIPVLNQAGNAQTL